MKKNKLIILQLILTFLTLSQFQAFAQFGKNKVQYRNFDWKYIETAHFDIYYYDNAKELAQFTSIHAEQAIKSIEKLLNHRTEKRIPIILYNSKNEFQQTNVINSYLPEGIGGVTELFKNRVVLPFLGDMTQFRHVIHHELVHAVLNDMFYGGTLQSSFSTGNFTDIPLWMNEGLAEYESIGGLDPNTDMFMRDVVLNENLVDLKRLDGYYAYRGGQAFYWYIAEKYGKERVGELINRLKASGNAELAFKNTFQTDMESFSDEWRRALKKYYMPDIEKYREPDEFSKRITNAKKERSYYNSSPAISPNGKYLAYISAREGLYAIYVQDIDNKENIRQIVSSLRAQDFEELNILTPGISWNHDGTKLAISAKAGGEDAIFIADAKTGDYDKITLGLQSITSVSWSPKTDELAFISSGPKGSDLYLYNIKTSKVKNLTNDLYSDAHPFWSWDGTKIFFVSDRGDDIDLTKKDRKVSIPKFELSKSDVYSLDIRTMQMERITFDPEFSKSSLVLSPDNKKMLYVSDKSGISNIYFLDLETRQTKPITNSLTAVSQLSITPDGKDLLFATMINGGSDIFYIKDPFTKNLEKDSLPTTKFRENGINKRNLKESLAKTIEADPNTNLKQKLVGYGPFNLEFSRQQIVKPNPDAIKVTDFAITDTVSNNLDSTITEQDYKINFTPDLVLGNPSVSTFYGYQGVAQMMFSDVMGNHQIYMSASLWLDLKNSNVFASYSYLADIIDYQVSIFHSSLLMPGYANDYYRFRNYGLGLNASYPFDLFTRLEWGVQLTNLMKEYVTQPELPSLNRTLVLPNVKFVYDDVLWGYFSPTKGTRYFLEVKGSPKIFTNGLSFLNFDIDFRKYYTFFNILTVAAKVSGGGSFGPNPQRFFLGGTENWLFAQFNNGILPFDKPEDFVLDQVKMPLRGFPVNTVNGSNYFLTSVELRFPLIQAMIAGPLPIFLHSIMGVVFMDVGGAWYGSLSSFKSSTTDAFGNLVPNDLRMSLGIGARGYIMGMPVKLDVGWRNEFYNWSQPYYMVSLGYDF